MHELFNSKKRFRIKGHMEEQLLISEEHCAVKIVEEENSSVDYNIRKGGRTGGQGSLKFEKEAD
jgi:hypothetical protein